MEIKITSDQYPFNILVLSDTHLRCGGALPDPLTRFFRDLQPELILHCGDIYSSGLLSDLGKIAPVYAVRGNRDILMWNRLPAHIDISVNRYRIHMEHGQGNLPAYLRKKIYFTWKRLMKEPLDYEKITGIRKDFRNYDVCIAGHTHHFLILQTDGALIVNPGHLNLRSGKEPDAPSFVLLSFSGTNIILRKFTVFEDIITEEEQLILK